MALVVPSILQPLLDWAMEHQVLFWWLGIGTILLSVVGILLVPKFVCRLPSRYFADMERVLGGEMEPPVRSLGRLVVQNIAGMVVLLAGVVLLFVPGQGLLTMFVGLLLLSFPGKLRLVVAMVRRPSVFRALNWMRRRAKAEEFAALGGAG